MSPRATILPGSRIRFLVALRQQLATLAGRRHPDIRSDDRVFETGRVSACGHGSPGPPRRARPCSPPVIRVRRRPVRVGGTDQETRRCPKDRRKLWVKPVVRPIRIATRRSRPSSTGTSRRSTSGRRSIASASGPRWRDLLRWCNGRFRGRRKWPEMPRSIASHLRPVEWSGKPDSNRRPSAWERFSPNVLPRAKMCNPMQSLRIRSRTPSSGPAKTRSFSRILLRPCYGAGGPWVHPCPGPSSPSGRRPGGSRSRRRRSTRPVLGGSCPACGW